MAKDISVFIAGAAGEGIQTVGDLVSQVLLSRGRPVFAFREYESRIRGGNSSVRIRISDPPINAPRDDTDILLYMNPAARDAYRDALTKAGLLIGADVATDRGVEVAFKELAEEHGGAELYANAAAAGALCHVLGIPFDALESTVRSSLSRHGEEAVESNVAVARAGYNALETSEATPHAVDDWEPRQAHALITGHEAVVLAAGAAGCRFMSAYPMSPSTSIITGLSRDADLGVFTEQAEDEIGAINMALGASAAGARAMVATSGGGFALMVESLSLAGMMELPLVIVLAQRPGPATGLPTRTAQEDLMFALHAGHGEFPRLIVAPSDPQSAIHETIRAFRLAERYQLPAIVLTDQYLDDAAFSLPELSVPKGAAERFLADPDEIEEYQRYALTDNGVSPLLGIGQSRHLVRYDSDEHDSDGHITEQLTDVRIPMVNKRLRKADGLRTEIEPPAATQVDGAEMILVGWGSTKAAIAEAAEILRERGRPVGTLHFTELWPLPDVEFVDAEYCVIEGNATGQFASLLESHFGLTLKMRILRYDGLPVTAAHILKEVD
jgi:2-oxoglutarate ferredoxin oxidoreductase subunit alpha